MLASEMEVDGDDDNVHEKQPGEDGEADGEADGEERHVVSKATVVFSNAAEILSMATVVLGMPTQVLGKRTNCSSDNSGEKIPHHHPTKESNDSTRNYVGP